MVPAVRTYRHIQSPCPPGDCLANLEFQSLRAKPQSHLAQVWRLLLPCWANLLFSSPSPCLPLRPQVPESIYLFLDPPSHPLSCILLLLASPSGTRSREKFHQAPLLIPPPKFFMDLWNWKAGKALRELIQLPPLTDEATWAPAAVCLPRATQPVGSRAEMRTQGS